MISTTAQFTGLCIYMKISIQFLLKSKKYHQFRSKAIYSKNAWTSAQLLNIWKKNSHLFLKNVEIHYSLFLLCWIFNDSKIIIKNLVFHTVCFTVNLLFQSLQHLKILASQIKFSPTKHSKYKVNFINFRNLIIASNSQPFLW